MEDNRQAFINGAELRQTPVSFRYARNHWALKASLLHLLESINKIKKMWVASSYVRKPRSNASLFAQEFD